MDSKAAAQFQRLSADERDQAVDQGLAQVILERQHEEADAKVWHEVMDGE